MNFKNTKSEYAKILGDGQMDCLQNLAHFLRIISPNTSNEMQESLRYGHCFGLSSIHGPMEWIGKLRWWESALYDLACWDGRKESLDKIVHLPDADDKEGTTRQQLYTRILNYVSSTHLSTRFLPESRITGINQQNAYDPIYQFEISSATQNLTVVSRTNIGGTFTKEQLASFLDEDFFTHATAIVTSSNHAIRIGYRGNHQWVFYDPNDAHNIKPPLHKLMSKKELIDKITKVLGSSLRLDIAHYKKPKHNPVKKSYELLFKENSGEMIKKDGFYLLAMCDPDKIEKIIIEANKNKELAQNLAQTILEHSKNIKNTNPDDSFYLNPLYIIATDFTHLLPSTIRILKRTEEGKRALEAGYAVWAQVNLKGHTALSHLAKDNPNQFTTFLKRLNHIGEAGYKVASQTLTVSEIVNYKPDKPGLYIIEKNAPASLSDLINLALKDKNGYLNLCAGLSINFKPENSSNISNCLDYFITSKSKNADVLLEILLAADTPEKLSTLLSSTNILATLAKHYPQKLIPLLTKGIEHKKVCESFLTALHHTDSGHSLEKILKNCDETTGAQIMQHVKKAQENASNSVVTSFKSSLSSPRLVKEFIIPERDVAIFNAWLDNAFVFVGKQDPRLMIEILQKCSQNQSSSDCVLAVLAETTSRGETHLEMLMKGCDPKILPEFIQNLKNVVTSASKKALAEVKELIVLSTGIFMLYATDFFEHEDSASARLATSTLRVGGLYNIIQRGINLISSMVSINGRASNRDIQEVKNYITTLKDSQDRESLSVPKSIK